MKRTVLFVNSRFLPLVGGGETYIFELMEYFVSKGWDVHLATLNCGITLQTWQGCTIHYIEGFDDEAQEPRKSLYDMRKILDAVQPDLVHVHNVWPFFTYSNVVQPGEFPTILSIHNVPVIPKRLFGNGSLGDYGVECAFLRQLLAAGKHDKFLVGSKHYMDSFAEALPELATDPRAEVAYYFLPRVTTGPFQPKESSFDGDVHLLFPSRVMPRKGIEEMLRALAMLPERFKLTLPAFKNGDFTDYQEHIKRLINELGITNRVALAAQPTALEDMPAYYKAADMTVIPSHFEGFGIVALEAMSWGTPVVAAGVGGLLEIVRDGENSVVIPPQNHTAIVAAVQRIADDEAFRKRIMQNGIKTAQTMYTYEQQMSQMATIYEEVIAKHR